MKNYTCENIDEDLKNIMNFISLDENKYEYNENKKFSLKDNEGVVYFIFVFDTKTKTTNLRYIGKSTGKKFKNRLKNHFFKQDCGTSSKFNSIKNEIDNGNKVLYSYVTTEPESYRNLLEEELIKKCKKDKDKDKDKLWNYNKDE